MGDVREGTAVNEGRRPLERLNQVRPDRLPQQQGHGTRHLQFVRPHGLATVIVADDDAAQPLLQILQARGETEDGHHLGGSSDHEAVLPRHAVDPAAESDDDVPQRPVVHVHGAAPCDLARVDPEPVPLLQVVVKRRREQRVRRRGPP